MLIRPAGSEDYAAYCALASEADGLHSENAPRYYRQGHRPSRPREYYDSVLADGTKGIFVAEIDGEVAGCIHLEERVEPNLPVLVPMKWVQVSEIMVGKNSQRRGVGRALMQQAKTWARERGCKDLRLTVADFNTGAKEFYLQEGFRTKSETLALPLEQDRRIESVVSPT